MFRTSLPWLATGRALSALVEELPTRGYKKYLQDYVGKKLKDEADGLLKVYRQEGEAHARYMDRDSEADSVLWGGGKDEHAEAVLKIVNIAAKSLSDSTARTQTRQKTL